MTRKRLPLALVAFAATFAIVGATLAAPPLQAFGTGDVSISDGTVTITNETGEYGGVSIQARSLSNRPLHTVDVSFTSSGDVTGGAPRFSIPIDTDGDRETDLYAFLAADRCGGSTDVETWVSTENADCIVDLNTGGFYANWDAFAAANPSWRISTDIPFIIADQPGIYVVSGVDLQ